MCINKFQSTLPHGERLLLSYLTIFVHWFQSTLPHGERLSKFAEFRLSFAFQSTLPHGERQQFLWRQARLDRFNPRSRMGSDLNLASEQPGSLVSIHAPAWGATDILDRCADVWEVSIHAPAWGATATRSALNHSCIVSIHAPAWGATSQGCCKRADCRVSIHAPAWGATIVPCCRLCNSMFQSTLPHGERLHHRQHQQDHHCFNPRSRMGSDF